LRSKHVETGHSRHLQIDEREVGMTERQLLQRIRPVDARRHIEPLGQGNRADLTQGRESGKVEEVEEVEVQKW
jgi:hypothetical protein